MLRVSRATILPSTTRLAVKLSTHVSRTTLPLLRREFSLHTRPYTRVLVAHQPCTRVRLLSTTPPTLRPQAYLESSPDPSRPDLFYHLTTLPHSPDPVYALSFLPTLPASIRPNSAAVIGWLPAAAEAEGESGLNDFAENSNFRAALHDAVGASLDEGTDEIWMNGALQTGAGWMHINDERNPPPLGRIGDPNDIIGSVRVEDGKILPGTYNPMPAYRLVTADGVATLTPGIAERLRVELQAIVDEEARDLA